MTTESQMMGATTPVGANNIVTSSRANAPPTMAPAEKPKKFSGIGFKRGQQKMFFYLTTLCLQRFTSEDAPEWNQDIKETVGALERKYKTEDAGIKKFLVARFLDFKMIDNKSVVSQVQELQVIIHDLLAEVAAIVEKLPPLWKDFKNYLKHKRKEMTIEDFIVRLRIEEDNKGAERRSKGNVEPYFEPVETAHDVIDYNCYLSILSIAPIGRPVHRSSTPAGPTNFAEETPLRPINLDAVYEYLDTGNLEQWLHGDVGPSSPLTWEIRMDIILGTAKGGLNHIKSSNILLDKKWNPKVSDFGLAKLLGAEKSYITTRIMGTFGPVFWASFVLFLLLNVSGVPLGVGVHDMDYVEAQENYSIEEENEVDAVNLDEDNENIAETFAVENANVRSDRLISLPVISVLQDLVKQLVLHGNFLNVYQILRFNEIFVNKYISIEVKATVPTNITPTIAPHPPEEPSSSKRPAHSGFRDSFFDLNCWNSVDERTYTSTYREELKYYLRTAPEDRRRRINTLDWWRSNETQYSVLSRLARDILNVPMSTVASESTFSQGRQQLGDNRHSLRSNAMNVLVCLIDWIRAERRKQGMEPEPSDELKLEKIMTSRENLAESSPMHGFSPVDFDYPMQVPVNINMNELEKMMHNL
ncbi:putative glucan endo-1,3-beta-glucosidase A-like [Capsicum annuum]|nr:putative glucan endo-1,3-beta-glucosidase A-like [Capsicum annuum]